MLSVEPKHERECVSEMKVSVLGVFVIAGVSVGLGFLLRVATEAQSKRGVAIQLDQLSLGSSSPSNSTQNEISQEASATHAQSTPDSTDAWIASLPLSGREKAVGFVNRNGVAFQSNSREVTAWMISRGFPTLEAVAEFDADVARARCSPEKCSDLSDSSLLAEKYVSDLELEASTLDPVAKARLFADAANYIDRARALRSVIYTAHLESRLERAMGNSSAANVAASVAAACGDRRVESSYTIQAMQVVRMIPGAQEACGFRPGLPQFPR